MHIKHHKSSQRKAKISIERSCKVGYSKVNPIDIDSEVDYSKGSSINVCSIKLQVSSGRIETAGNEEGSKP
jgi:hypothetical protein